MESKKGTSKCRLCYYMTMTVIGLHDRNTIQILSVFVDRCWAYCAIVAKSAWTFQQSQRVIVVEWNDSMTLWSIHSARKAFNVFFFSWRIAMVLCWFDQITNLHTALWTNRNESNEPFFYTVYFMAFITLKCFTQFGYRRLNRLNACLKKSIIGWLSFQKCTTTTISVQHSLELTM